MLDAFIFWLMKPIAEIAFVIFVCLILISISPSKRKRKEDE